jgi:hypothetical protein
MIVRHDEQALKTKKQQQANASNDVSGRSLFFSETKTKQNDSEFG